MWTYIFHVHSYLTMKLVFYFIYEKPIFGKAGIITYSSLFFIFKNKIRKKTLYDSLFEKEISLWSKNGFEVRLLNQKSTTISCNTYAYDKKYFVESLPN